VLNFPHTSGTSQFDTVSRLFIRFPYFYHFHCSTAVCNQ
jgi:hypothetical protein